MSTADQNASRTKNGFRFDNDIKTYATYIRMLEGPKLYHFMQKNLEHALPSLSSANRYVQKSNCRVIEGILRCDELLVYLKDRNLDPVVALSEDATRIVGRIQYDIKSNEIIGFTLPLNEMNGLPIPFSYSARNANEIIEHFSSGNTTASFVNVVMAKPVTTQKIPAFCLLLFGSNNDYSRTDVCNRWKYIISKLRQLDIKIISISSDSDPRYNSAMRELSSLGNSSKLFPKKTWFCYGDLVISKEIRPVHV